MPTSRPLVLLALLSGCSLFLAAAPASAQIACGDTVTTSITLTADLTCAGAQGIVVGADKVTVDLGGFTLTGGGSGVGVDNGLGFDGVVVKNGTIRLFDQAISIGGGAQKNTVTGVTIRACTGAGIDLNDSDFGKVTKTNVLDCGLGVQIGVDGTGNVIEKSSVVAVDQAGVQVAGANNVVQKNQISGANDGVRVLGAGNRVIGNGVDRCRAMGVAVGGGLGNFVAKNTVTGSTGSGVDVRNGVGTIVKQNTLSGNGNYGVGVFLGSDDTVVEKNAIRGSDLSGIWVEDAGTVAITGNTVLGSREDGIHVGPTSTRLTKNTANANQLAGIRAATTAVDGGGNRAQANVVVNCEGIACQ